MMSQIDLLQAKGFEILPKPDTEDDPSKKIIKLIKSYLRIDLIKQLPMVDITALQFKDFNKCEQFEVFQKSKHSISVIRMGKVFKGFVICEDNSEMGSAKVMFWSGVPVPNSRRVSPIDFSFIEKLKVFSSQIANLSECSLVILKKLESITKDEKATKKISRLILLFLLPGSMKEIHQGQKRKLMA